jgi:hypothetical protein
MGTSPEGRDLGSAHFLIFETANYLREREFAVLNLGGASLEARGLQDFKAGFGTIQRPLVALEIDLRTELQKTILQTIGGLRAKLGTKTAAI